MKKVGLFFGSFNPIHVGHMIIADFVANHTDCAEVWFVVSPHNPLKEKSELLDGHARLSMVRRATDGDLRFKVSSIEFDLDQPSYTIHTLDALKKRHPKYEFSLIMGTDALESLPKWKDYQRIIENYRILVYGRSKETSSVISSYSKAQRLDSPMLDISSSRIRQYIQQGKTVKYLMPHGAWTYLEEMNFYKSQR